MKMEVYSRSTFVAFHQWKNAPDKYGYLGSVHRHMFHVEAAVGVQLSDREVEFHELKMVVEKFCNVHWANSIQSHLLKPVPIEASCELMATQIANHLRECGYSVHYVDVSEDGECGGRVIYE